MEEKQSRFFFPGFPLWFTSRFLSNLARKMVAVALAWHVYELSKSPLALGLLGLAEALPFLAVSLWAGHLVDRHSKKIFMLWADAIHLACAGMFLYATFLPRVPLPLLYLVVGLTGVGVSFGSVASSAYVQSMVSREKFSRAAAWNLASFTTALIAGPIAAGAILSASSPRTVYALGLGLLGAALSMTALLNIPHMPPVSFTESALVRVREGVRFVLSKPLILACMSLDMVAVLFGDAVALFPIFAVLLKAGPLGFGVLRASPPLGAALVSIAHASRPFIRPGWKNLKRVVFAFGVCMIAFALSRDIAFASLFLVLSGMADGTSVIIRQSVYQANTPDALRGRVAAMSGIFISTSNEIGAFESGLAARWLGAVPSVLFGASVTLASVFFMGLKYRRLEEGKP